MKAEFVKDDNGNVWLLTVRDIHIRRCRNKLGLQVLTQLASEEKIRRVKAQ